MKRLSGYSETWLEKKLAAGLTARGLLNFHMSDPTKPGIPDRYVVGGNWIEVKQGKTFADLRSGFDRQRTFLDKLEHGDNTFVCALWQQNNFTLPMLFLEYWRVWKRREQDALIGDDWYRSRANSPFIIRELLDLDRAWDNLGALIRA